jgi:hypothetical protein
MLTADWVKWTFLAAWVKLPLWAAATNVLSRSGVRFIVGMLQASIMILDGYHHINLFVKWIIGIYAVPVFIHERPWPARFFTVAQPQRKLKNLYRLQKLSYKNELKGRMICLKIKLNLKSTSPNTGDVIKT